MKILKGNDITLKLNLKKSLAFPQKEKLGL